MASAGSSGRGSEGTPETPEPTPVDGQADPVLSSWSDIRGLLERAGKGRIIRVPFNGLDRQAVIDNADILEPVILAYGCLPSFSFRL